jgi:ABC-type polysaccharide/polyol phosphate export permease
MILFSFCLGSAFWVISETGPFRIHPDIVEQLLRLSLCCFGVGVGLSVSGFMHVWRDTPEKVQAVVRKIGLEIENLQKMLRTKSPHDET